MGGSVLQHEHCPVYLGVTLDQTISLREHLAKTTAKVRHRNQLLSKLAGTSWGFDASTLRITALSLCDSAAKYYCLVVGAHGQIGRRFNDAMRIVTATVRSTQVTWIPVLANIPPPHLRRLAATDLIHKISVNKEWPLRQDVFHHPKACLSSMDDNIIINDRWRESWRPATMVNKALVSDSKKSIGGAVCGSHEISIVRFNVVLSDYFQVFLTMNQNSHCSTVHPRIVSD